MTRSSSRYDIPRHMALLLAFSFAACAPKSETPEAPASSMTAMAPEADEKAEGAESAESAVGEESAAALAAEAKVTDADARTKALSTLPGGTIKEGGLEREGGKLLYSFDIVVAGKTGIEEVQIDAITGAVLSSKHETPADEAKEAAEDAAKMKSSTTGVKKP